MEKMRNWSYVIALVLILSGCTNNSGGGDPQTPPPPPPPPPPSAVTLIFPDNNAECNEGVIIDETQSQVTFEWSASQNTDSYEVNLRNLDTNETANINSATTSVPIVIDRGAPYEWYVVSKANNTSATASSATWKFYNQGPGITNYAPFPAEAVFPSRGSSIPATGTVTLEWSATDVDDDIVEFDIYFGTAADPVTLLGTTPDTTLEATIDPATTYYWRVITRDSAGNTSESEIFVFQVN